MRRYLVMDLYNGTDIDILAPCAIVALHHAWQQKYGDAEYVCRTRVGGASGKRYSTARAPQVDAGTERELSVYWAEGE